MTGLVARARREEDFGINGEVMESIYSSSYYVDDIREIKEANPFGVDDVSRFDRAA
jgi:hypothetical protein